MIQAMAEGLSSDGMILLLRVAVVAILYLFLLTIVIVIQRELGAESSARRATAPRGRLIILDPGTSARIRGQAIPLEPVTRVGRSEANTLVLDDEFVSTAHAMVVLREGRWWVRDEGSTNGTMVNGQRVDGETPIRDGDELQIGRVRLRLAR
jgi:pSer/pThr/pTyr-binding forkhead associated (FHA) protein